MALTGQRIDFSADGVVVHSGITGAQGQYVVRITFSDSRSHVLQAVLNGGTSLEVRSRNLEVVATTALGLHVGRWGAGRGTVTADPPVVDCGTDCREYLAPADPPTGVTLTATPAPGSTFKEWMGACSGVQSVCTLAMDTSKLVVAVFETGTSSFLVSAGGSHSCAADPSGSAWCWGANQFGQLGDGSSVMRTSPVPVVGLSPAISISAGGQHSCALVSAGTTWCWGANQFGQLGDGTLTGSSSPVQVSGLPGVRSVSAGGSHSCAVTGDGAVWCWGANQFGQLGNGSTLNSSTPVKAAAVTKALTVASGGFYSCALTTEADVWCWGANQSGQLGNDSFADSALPARVILLFGPTWLSAGNSHTCATLSDGTAECWGLNSAGQIGNGNLNNQTRPAGVAGLQDASTVDAGGAHTCATLRDGSAACWGSNRNAQLGNGTAENSPLGPVVDLDPPVTSISAGEAHSCAAAGEAVRCWGWNGSGEAGDGTGGLTKSLPTKVAGLASTSGLAAGDYHACALLLEGTVSCWGSNLSGQVGNGRIEERRPAPDPVTSLSGATAVGSGIYHTCAVVEGGTARCWGRNQWYQLGNLSNQTAYSPTPVVGLAGAVQIDGGWSHTCALLATTTAKCWGLNTSGQLGNGAVFVSQVPLPVTERLDLGSGRFANLAMDDAVAITAGHLHTCALISDGTVRCWGSNSFGQLGDGTKNNRTGASPVKNLSGVVAVSAGAYHTCAATNDGSAWCWGLNATGQIGDGTTIDKLTPVKVSGVSGAVAIAAGGWQDFTDWSDVRSHTCALLSEGTAQCWGSNDYGQLGDGTYLAQLTPVAVQGLSGAVEILAGGLHTCARVSDGGVRCWGDNLFGQIGDDSIIKKRPVTALAL